MSHPSTPKSFEVFGFTIEVHAGGRRVWPPSFKKFISNSLDDGTLKVEDVVKRCNVSQSLVYKWRADIAKHPAMADIATNTSAFSEILIEADDFLAAVIVFYGVTYIGGANIGWGWLL